MTVISKSERLLNLVSFLLKSRQPVSFAKIRESVVGYRDERENRASLERRFERDKAALRELGVPLKFEAEGELGGTGYVLPRERISCRTCSFRPPRRRSWRWRAGFC